MKRVEYRDTHLRQCLLSFAVIYGLGSGMQIAGTKADAPVIHIALFAFPISLLFFSLYQKEELLIAALSEYVKKLSRQNERAEPGIKLWDDSDSLSGILAPSMNYRVISTIVAFTLIPAALLFDYFQRTGVRSVLDKILILVSAISAVFIVNSIARTYRQRMAAISSSRPNTSTSPG
ncbi:MAG: hypothetical protein KF715_01830 [Candidatus Didemnitutus sp.]|nr:hypothetical protein [Candidatus Didemnitutus sp.]